jgi:uncharacterized protein
VGILTDDMKRMVEEQQLGFHATVCEDGTPNLSPKGTTGVWDDDSLFFADICSPRTVANIKRGSVVEVNVVDAFLGKGYRFKGSATVHEPGAETFVQAVERLRASGSTLADRIKAIVVIQIKHAAPLISPVYDHGITTEVDVFKAHQARFARFHEQRLSPK